MSLTIGLAGMDPATETALKAAFAEANERLSARWTLLPETQADHIVVDMDSMYGPMSWLRLHAAGKQVIGLTSAKRTQTDFRLSRPFGADSLVALLQEISGDAAPVAEPAADEAPTAPVNGAEVPAAAAPTATEAPPPAAAEPPPAASQEPAAAAAPPAPAPEPTPEPEPAPEPEPEPAPSGPRTLFDWLSGNTLRGRLRYRRPSGPNLLIDADARSYHGPAALKPLAQYFDGEVAQQDFETPEAADWDREAAEAGAAQPLSRLLWLGALLTGKGSLLPGLDPAAKYQLNRWPQIEREYPRHFRIATAMMKGPATLDEIAATSSIAREEIADFVNASLASGFAEPVREAPPPPPAPTRSGGLLGRLRGR